MYLHNKQILNHLNLYNNRDGAYEINRRIIKPTTKFRYRRI